MVDLNEVFQSADWKTEKHIPAIDIEKGKNIKVKIMVGKEISHPNTTGHHIRWIEAYFLPEGEKFAVHIGRAEFNAHGASGKGADSSTLYTEPRTTFVLKTEKSGTVLATSYCNIHGLWRSSVELKL